MPRNGTSAPPAAVDARVSALLVVLGGPRIHQVHRPPLELVRADFLERLGAREARGRITCQAGPFELRPGGGRSSEEEGGKRAASLG
jgi:hypothetical protein